MRMKHHCERESPTQNKMFNHRAQVSPKSRISGGELTMRSKVGGRVPMEKCSQKETCLTSSSVGKLSTGNPRLNRSLPLRKVFRRSQNMAAGKLLTMLPLTRKRFGSKRSACPYNPSRLKTTATTPFLGIILDSKWRHIGNHPPMRSNYARLHRCNMKEKTRYNN